MSTDNLNFETGAIEDYAGELQQDPLITRAGKGWKMSFEREGGGGGCKDEVATYKAPESQAIE